MTSACIKWAKEHLDAFNTLLARQLSSVERGTTVWQKCLEIVHEHAELLVNVGVDFGDLVARGLDEAATEPHGGRAEIEVASSAAE